MNHPFPHHDRRAAAHPVRLAARLAAATAMLVALVSLVGTPASAAAGDGSGWARFGHFAPSVAGVDVTVDGAPFAQDVGFKTVSAYQPLAPGVHLFEVRPAGQPDAEAAVSVQANVPADGSITVGAVTTRDGVTPQVFEDQLATPEAGQSLVRFIHAAPDAAAVDISATGAQMFVTDVPYPEATAYQAIKPGQYDVQITDADTGDVVLEVAEWSINAGEQSTIVVVQGTDGRLDVAPVVDSVAMAVAPAGGVQTGFGGMSDTLDPVSGSHRTTLMLAAVSSVVLGSGLLVARRRRVRVGGR